MWFEGLEEASRLYYGEQHNVQGMIDTLAPLHRMLERVCSSVKGVLLTLKGPETLREVSFQNQFGHDLQEALELCKVYFQKKYCCYSYFTEISTLQSNVRYKSSLGSLLSCEFE